MILAIFLFQIPRGNFIKSQIKLFVKYFLVWNELETKSSGNSSRIVCIDSKFIHFWLKFGYHVHNVKHYNNLKNFYWKRIKFTNSLISFLAHRFTLKLYFRLCLLAKIVILCENIYKIDNLFLGFQVQKQVWEKNTFFWKTLKFFLATYQCIFFLFS